jgi:hypothetical protein
MHTQDMLGMQFSRVTISLQSCCITGGWRVRETDACQPGTAGPCNVLIRLYEGRAQACCFGIAVLRAPTCSFGDMCPNKFAAIDRSSRNSKTPHRRCTRGMRGLRLLVAAAPLQPHPRPGPHLGAAKGGSRVVQALSFHSPRGREAKGVGPSRLPRPFGELLCS